MAGDLVPTLTLHQPWASLIAEGVKTIETRSWPAPEKLIGQHIAIHAGAKIPREGDEVGDWIIERWRDVPSRACMVRNGDHRCPVDLPLGAIVATARLTACVPMVDVIASEAHSGPYLELGRRLNYAHVYFPGDPAPTRCTDQLPYGDFAPGRWAWLLEDVKPTSERCPGCLGDGARWRSDDGGSMLNCRVCHGTGRCAPVPAKGRQRVWYWTPGDGR